MTDKIVDMKKWVEQREYAQACETSLARCERLSEILQADQNPPDAAFDLWVTLIHLLVDNGWTEKELLDAVQTHVEIERNHLKAGREPMLLEDKT